MLIGAVAFVVLLAAAGPWLAPHPPDRIVAPPYTPPGHGLLLGSDHLGRDVLSRTLHGGRPLLVLPLIAVMVATAIGALLGTAAALAGGRRAGLITHVANLMLTIPPIVVLLVLLAGWGADAPILMLAVVLTGAPFATRLARAAALPIASAGYVEQAPALGEGRCSILIREVIPNVAGSLLADAGTRLVAAIYLVAIAAFLGFAGDTPNWGAMLDENLEGIALNGPAAIAPAVLLTTLTVGVNLLVDDLAGRLAR